MGLSNEERQTKMYWAIHRLAQESRELPAEGYPSKRYERLRALCDQLWFAFLGHTANSAHWFTGSSTTNNIGPTTSPWAVALTHHFEVDRYRDTKSWMDEAKEREKAKYVEQSKKDRDLADVPDDGFITQSLDINNLLMNAHDGKRLATTYSIYAGTEDLAYALRRYTDDFRAGYPALDKLVADIQGECFALFADNEMYAKAYLLNQILNAMYAHKNPVAKLARFQNWHHHFANTIRHADLKTMRKWHLTATKDPTATDWVVLALTMMGTAYNYEHQYAELCRVAAKRGIVLDEARCRRAFDACLKAKKEKSEASSKDYATDAAYEHMTAIHGHDLAYKLIGEPKHKARTKPNVERTRKAVRKEAVINKAAEALNPEEIKS